MRNLKSVLALSLSILALPGCGEAQSNWGKSACKDMAGTPLIPRSAIFGNADKASPQISPDGTRLAYLAEVGGVMNVWVGPAENPRAARPVTQDTKRGIRQYQWSFDNRHILYVQDKDGDENWHVYAADVNAKQTRDLTPLEGVQARIEYASHRVPGEVLIGLNDRNKQYHDVYRVNIESGERKLVQQNDEYANFVADDDLNIRLAGKMTPDGGMEMYLPADGGKSWTLFSKVPAEDQLTTEPEGFDKSGKVLYMIDSRGRNTSAFLAHNLETGEQKVLATNAHADVSGAMIHPTERTVEAVSFTYQREEWTVLDSAVQRDLDALKKVADGDVEVISRSVDDKRWVVSYMVDNGPVRYYQYDRPTGKAHFLFTNRKALESLPLTKMHCEVIPSRDGKELVSYLSLPAWEDRTGNGQPAAPLPMVLFVHGGPWGRDNWGLNASHQWLANRGYAVLSVNFRSSTGLGKSFINAGNLEWGRKMHDDLLDAVNWAVTKKIADPNRVAIMGGSYGGYATLAALTMTPEVFACGVDIVGPSNLITLLNSIPPYWKPILDTFTTRVGDHRTEEGRKLLTERSPLTYTDRIKRPLLIGQGANDPRVKQAESDQIVQAMKQKNIPVTYVLYPDEGHGFARPENRTSFNAVAEAFLAQHLGGRFQAIGKDFRGSSITAPEGAEHVPGLKDALAK